MTGSSSSGGNSEAGTDGCAPNGSSPYNTCPYAMGITCSPYNNVEAGVPGTLPTPP
jgi:hypothetical protein